MNAFRNNPFLAAARAVRVSPPDPRWGTAGVCGRVMLVRNRLDRIADCGRAASVVVRPPPAPPRIKGGMRRGFTLLEMMLICAILTVSFAMAWPSMNRMYQDSQLRAGVELVQVRLASTRVRAVDSGLMYQFRYEPGGRRFIILPYDQEGELTADMTAGNTGNTQGHVVWNLAGRLGETLKFSATNENGLGSAQQLPAQWLNGLPEAGEILLATWSQPLYYFPDGSSSGGFVDVHDNHGQFARVSIRTLTGGVTVSKIEKLSK